MFLLAAILVLATLTILALGTPASGAERPAPKRIPVRVREHLRDRRRR